ncbi:Flagellar motor switch protein FliG [Caprobacter fermentans]|uniref:Flagellar motor switch protein FliG n=1 Tax=Caproicibacter fermentans TaxID=2576756 RepID=A0A6N8HVB8_9FIRM|nr:flagellar motor switch protein FliG [Caproicibacter fermentans]MVB09734.1 Flagellar motor switch protein FliG [Caproicibacter fermentans]OCN03142.1 flagellar motor switch protein FliG [Clostridium sp. W14A]QNK42381.1 flagellar motor switch protein FliG [Caproicibacter fermentans]
MPEHKISGAQKAASVIIALGSDAASKIYKYLREEEVEQLTLEIARTTNLPPDAMESILGDFYNLCLTQKVITDGGVEYARNVLEKAYGAQMASSLLDRVTKSLRSKAFEFLRKADYKNLLTAIQNEHPQTIALILSYARADQAATVIADLPPDKQSDVVQRIATMDRIIPDVVKIIENNLSDKFSNVMSVDMTQFGGVDYVADIMNNMDRTNEKSIFDDLNRKNAELSEEIRQKMFVFEDIVILDSMSIQRFLREVDPKDIVYALKGANKEVADTIFSNMSSRSAETVKSDLEYTHNVRLRDVEEAQQRIVGVIRRLESEGELVISKGGKDEIIE